MLFSALRRLRHQLSDLRTQRQLRRYRIPDALWLDTLSLYPFLAYRSPEQVDELRRLASLFLASKEFMISPQGTEVGLQLTDEIAVAVAAQACVPIIGLEGQLAWYDNFVGIVVQPDQVVARRQWIDEHTGLFHEHEEIIAGEAMPGGPVMLSWADVQEAGLDAEAGYNVVIHEFAHVIDMHRGAADGLPLIRDPDLRRDWVRVIRSELKRLRRQVRQHEATFLDPYACEGEEEFFPVASEAFFVAPQALSREHSELYALLARFYGQQPHLYAADLDQGRTKPPK
jgi:Mlc titration factor MtfA (ptsG expression regulator)